MLLFGSKQCASPMNGSRKSTLFKENPRNRAASIFSKTLSWYVRRTDFCNNHTHIHSKLTLLVVSSAAFGRSASWSEDSSAEPPPGHRVAFCPAITSAIHYLLPRALTPGWLWNLSEHLHIPLLGVVLKETRESFEAVRLHLMDLISLSRAWVAGGKSTSMDAALLRNLVEANMTQEDDPHQKRLTDEELLSDTFVRFSWCLTVCDRSFCIYSSDVPFGWTWSVK